MTHPRGRSLGWFALLAVSCSLPAGCSLLKPAVDQSLLARKTSADSPDYLAAGYLVRFPDEVEVRIEGRPSWSGRIAVPIDGRLRVADGVEVQAEGLSAVAIRLAIADAVGAPPERVTVRVVAHKSQQIYIQGEVKGASRSVEYVGPETVVEMLQRVGGITPGASVSDVQVLRANIASGKQPEVFQVDLEAILRENDNRTNVRLQPSDQISVGETTTSSRTGCLPPWLRPLYLKLTGQTRPGQEPPPRRRPLRERRQDALAKGPRPRYTPTPRE
jgi:protein involved in polysaccharide export with SLBB domain